jgi:hypothetical protein
MQNTQMEPLPIPFAEIDGNDLPQGARKIREVGDVSFFQIAWTIAVRKGAVYYLGSEKADEQIAQLIAIEEQVKRTQERLEALLAESQRLTDTIIPTPESLAKKAKASAKKIKGSGQEELVVCGIDGCTVAKSARGIQIHRARIHSQPLAARGDDCAKEAAGAEQDGPFDAIAQAQASAPSAD